MGIFSNGKKSGEINLSAEILLPVLVVKCLFRCSATRNKFSNGVWIILTKFRPNLNNSANFPKPFFPVNPREIHLRSRRRNLIREVRCGESCKNIFPKKCLYLTRDKNRKSYDVNKLAPTLDTFFGNKPKLSCGFSFGARPSPSDPPRQSSKS